MGVSIGVESILTSAARRPANGPRLEDLDRDKLEVVKTIERELGLRPLPWEERGRRAHAAPAPALVTPC